MSQHPDGFLASLHQIRYHHRTLFLSDLHLGAPGCQAGQILAFLQENTADRLYLVGDIIDVFHPRHPRWTAEHDQIVTLIQARIRLGMEVVLLAGNHDAALLGSGLTPFGVPARSAAVHQTANGQSYLVLHGDICDARLFRWHLWTRIGSRIDGTLRGLDRSLRRLRRNLDPGHRSLIERLLGGVSALLSLGTSHERRLAALASAEGHSGVVCGHFHRPALHNRKGITYANCGDWVDSMTAIAEDASGTLRLILAPAPRPVAAGQPVLPELEPTW